jgi:hypothetical protein
MLTIMESIWESAAGLGDRTMEQCEKHGGGTDMRCCGVDISGTDLIIAIVDGDAGGYSYTSTKPSKIKLSDDEDQASVRSFYDTVKDFMRVNHIELVAIKKRAGKGRFAGGSVTFKIEALLQVMTDCQVRLYAPTTIAAKTKSLKLSVPKEVFAYQKDAYLTACCALESQDTGGTTSVSSSSR